MKNNIHCERCGAKMEFDGDDAYVCPECGAFAIVEEDGIYFNDEDLDYEHVGEQKYCPKCGTRMICVEDGWECDECGKYIPE